MDPRKAASVGRVAARAGWKVRALGLKIAKRPRELDESEVERKHLQRLASQVPSEEVWAEVLANATSDDVRAMLVEKVAPMLSFRRAAVCTTPGCESGEQGTWTPALACTNIVDQSTLSYVSIQLKLCDTCKDDASLADFLTDDIWAQILAAWDPDDIPPSRDMTTLQWERAH